MSLFSFDSVSVSFGSRQVLSEFTLSISRGDKVVIQGPSGAGKSTLLRLLLGFYQPDFGSVCFRGKDLTPNVAKEVRKSVAYVSQAFDMEPGTVSEALAEIFSIKACGYLPPNEKVIQALARVDLPESVLEQNFQELSGGERHRVGLAIALLMNRQVFFLDEPTAALDAVLKETVADLFLGNPEWTVIAIAHDPVWFEGREVTVINIG